jgi:hypothetical protein
MPGGVQSTEALEVQTLLYLPALEVAAELRAMQHLGTVIHFWRRRPASPQTPGGGGAGGGTLPGPAGPVQQDGDAAPAGGQGHLPGPGRLPAGGDLLAGEAEGGGRRAARRGGRGAAHLPPPPLLPPGPLQRRQVTAIGASPPHRLPRLRAGVPRPPGPGVRPAGGAHAALQSGWHKSDLCKSVSRCCSCAGSWSC